MTAFIKHKICCTHKIGLGWSWEVSNGLVLVKVPGHPVEFDCVPQIFELLLAKAALLGVEFKSYTPVTLKNYLQEAQMFLESLGYDYQVRVQHQSPDLAISETWPLPNEDQTA